MRSLALLVLVFALPGACAASEAEASAFDSSRGEVAITVLGDGFVRQDGRRQPLEAAVLELRQRVRAMPREDVRRFVVRLDSAPTDADPAAVGRCRAELDRMLRELEIMGVKQVRLQ